MRTRHQSIQRSCSTCRSPATPTSSERKGSSRECTTYVADSVAAAARLGAVRTDQIDILMNLQIFKIYKQQANARSNWATTLWSNLSPDLLDEGIDAFIIYFESLDKWVMK